MLYNQLKDVKLQGNLCKKRYYEAENLLHSFFLCTTFLQKSNVHMLPKVP